MDGAGEEDTSSSAIEELVDAVSALCLALAPLTGGKPSASPSSSTS